MTLELTLELEKLFLWIWISTDDELFLSADWPLGLRLNELFLEPWLLLDMLKAGEGEAVEGGDSLRPPLLPPPPPMTRLSSPGLSSPGRAWPESTASREEQRDAVRDGFCLKLRENVKYSSMIFYILGRGGAL